jgi:ankyrin repeat protein
VDSVDILSAANKGYEAVVKLLLETGKVSPELKDGDGWTPLLHAVEGGSVGFYLITSTQFNHMSRGSPLDRWLTLFFGHCS